MSSVISSPFVKLHWISDNSTSGEALVIENDKFTVLFTTPRTEVLSVTTVGGTTRGRERERENNDSKTRASNPNNS